MIELEHNGERYMVENGKWYRRLKVGEMVSYHTELRSEGSELWHKCHLLVGGVVFNGDEDDYRISCTDPRPPFVVGQMVKVARKDESWEWWDVSDENLIGESGSVLRMDRDGDCRIRFDCGYWASFPPWCLDHVEPSPADDEGYKHVPFKKVGTIVGKFIPCEVSPLEAAIQQEQQTLTQEESARLDEIIEKGLARPTVEIPMRVSEQKEQAQ